MSLFDDPEIRALEQEAYVRKVKHQAYCYGSNCISCGCKEGAACAYHRDGRRWTNELLERIAVALETGK